MRVNESTGILLSLAIRTMAGGLAILLLTFGVCGFVSGCVDRYDRLALAGVGSAALLFGVFQVSVLANVIHLILGVFGLASVGRPTTAVRWMSVAGMVCLLLWVYGLIVTTARLPGANVVPLNVESTWLHFALGVILAGAGLMSRFPARLAEHATRPPHVPEPPTAHR